MRITKLAIFIVLALCGCNRQPASTAPGGQAAAKTLVEARKGFVTKPTPGKMDQDPVETPPAKLFQAVRYD